MSESFDQEREPREGLSEREKADLGRLGLDESSLEQIFEHSPDNHGTVATTFITHPEKEDLIIKRGNGSSLGQDQKVEREHVVLRLLRRAGTTHTPEVKAFLPSENAIIETKALGENPSELTEEVTYSMAQALAEIHQPIFQRYGKPLSNRKSGNQMDYFADNVEDLTSRLRATPDLSPSLQSSLLAVIERNIHFAQDHAESFAGDKFSLIHFDLNLSNIFWDQSNNKITLVDWGAASIGDPAMDLAKFFFKCKLNEDQQRTFLETYEKIAPSGGLHERIQAYRELVRVNSLLWRYNYIHETRALAGVTLDTGNLAVIRSRIKDELRDLGINFYD